MHPSEVVTVTQLICKVLHDVSEDHRVQVFSQHVQEIPVAHLALPDDGVYRIPSDEAEPHAHDVNPHPGRQDDDDAVNDGEEGQDAEDDEPEPKEDVDLLVDDVQGKDAEGVVPLHLSAGAELVEQGALDHSETNYPISHCNDMIFI